jgi:hypothetical protein
MSVSVRFINYARTVKNLLGNMNIENNMPTLKTILFEMR